MYPKQKGFTLLECLIVIVTLGIGVAVSLTFYSRQQESLASSNQSKQKDESFGVVNKEVERKENAVKTAYAETKKYFSFVDGKIRFDNDGTWKLASGGYWSNELQRCGRHTDRDPDCLDTQMLVPSEDTFTNPDQYQVNISVFSSHVSIEGLRPNDTEIKRDTTFSLPEYGAEKYHVTYTWVYPEPDEPSKRVTYLLKAGVYTIKIHSTFFNGNHASFKSDKNYYPMEEKVDALVKTLKMH